MATYRFTAMDPGGRVITDAIEADSPGDAVQQIRARGLFPTKLQNEADDSVDLPIEVPSVEKPVEGRAFERGRIRCTVRKDGVETAGSFNMLGEGGKIYIIVDVDPMEAPSLKIPMRDVARFRRSGLLWRRLTVEMKSGVKYVFKGDAHEIEKHLRFGKFVSDRQP